MNAAAASDADTLGVAAAAMVASGRSSVGERAKMTFVRSLLYGDGQSTSTSTK